MTPDLINHLLTQPELTDQLSVLQAANLLDEDGLLDVLDYGRQLIGRHPDQARQLAALGIVVAETIGTPLIVPPAHYLQAQTYALQGAFATALDLIEQARDAYLARGQTLEALGTTVGLMSVLGELGRYQEALDSGRATLATLETSGGNATEEDAAEMSVLAAKVYQNLGTCYKHLGRYETALAAYAAAEMRYQALDMEEAAAEVMMNRGIALLHLGRGNEALELCTAAASTFQQADNWLRQAQALENVGNVYLMLGNYTQCLDVLEQARRLLLDVDAAVEQDVLSSITADAYLSLNLYPEAIAAYQEAEVGLQAAGMVYERAWTLWGLGAALAAQTRYDEAGAALSGAADLFRELGNNHLLSAVLLEQAALLAKRGERGAALQQTRQALELVGDNAWPVQRVYALLRMTDLLLPDVVAAESLLQEAQTILADLPLPHLRFRLLQRLGRLYLLQGRDQEAEALLETAVQETDQIRGTLAREAMRISFLRDKTAVYEDLTQLYLGRGDEASLQKAFVIAEQAKSRSLVDWLLGVMDTTLDTESDPALVARLQALQADLNAAYNELLDYNQEGERSALLADVNQRVQTLENEISRLRLQLVEKQTTPADFHLTGDARSAAGLRHSLAADVTLLAYHLLGDEVLVFIYRDGELRVRRNLTSRTTVERLLGELTIEWDRFRAGTAFVTRHLNRLEHSAQQVLQRLYEALVAPLAADISPVIERGNKIGGTHDPRLVVVPHGLLHHIPFQALFDGECYLLERFQISYAPSATVLALCQRRRFRHQGRAVVVGVADPLIPNVTREAQRVAEQLPSAQLLLDEAATLAAFHQSAYDCRLLHLACHGLFRADNPLFSALKLSDGWLTAADVTQMTLPNALVILSACESGRSEVIGGDEIVGLVRSFLGAGAAGLIVSLWLVEDEVTAELMATLYQVGNLHSSEQLPSSRRYDPKYAAALHTAQLAVKERYSHPYYWAPFVYVGRV